MNIAKIIELARKKVEIDKNDEWSKGSYTYFDEIKKEIKETEAENKENNQVKLEDELGDIFWDYTNILVNLESEGKIKLENVFLRSLRKYEERISGIQNNIPWSEIKKKQKEDIQKEIKQNKHRTQSYLID